MATVIQAGDPVSAAASRLVGTRRLPPRSGRRGGRRRAWEEEAAAALGENRTPPPLREKKRPTSLRKVSSSPSSMASAERARKEVGVSSHGEVPVLHGAREGGRRPVACKTADGGARLLAEAWGACVKTEGTEMRWGLCGWNWEEIRWVHAGGERGVWPIPWRHVTDLCAVCSLVDYVLLCYVLNIL